MSLSLPENVERKGLCIKWDNMKRDIMGLNKLTELDVIKKITCQNVESRRINIEKVQNQLEDTKMNKRLFRLLLLFIFCTFVYSCESDNPIFANGKPIEVKVVTIVTFQDLDAIDKPNTGEAFWWFTAGGLNNAIPLPGGFAPIFTNASKDHLLLITGSGKCNAAASMMSLGLNNSFDFSNAYFMVAGISGGRPEVTTIGSAVWATWIVDAGLAAEIDPRELPDDVEFPFFRLGCTIPPFCSMAFDVGTELYRLDSDLVEWAVKLSNEISLSDSEMVQEIRDKYPQNAARQKPSIQRGDDIASDTFLHGKLLSNFMSWWMENFTDGEGIYYVSDFEDTAIATALKRLEEAGRVDFNRLMILRSPSNFDQQHPGQTALESLSAASSGGMPDGAILAFENVYLAGSAVANQIIENWEVWREGPPPLD
jgi:purine nucleoside permease